MTELMNIFGVHASCAALLLVMAFLSFGQKLISSPEESEDKKSHDYGKEVCSEQ